MKTSLFTADEVSVLPCTVCPVCALFLVTCGPTVVVMAVWNGPQFVCVVGSSSSAAHLAFCGMIHCNTGVCVCVCVCVDPPRAGEGGPV